MDLEREKLLVELAKTNAQSFAELYDEYYSKIFGYTLRKTASVAIAQDVTSETFFKALKHIQKFQWRGIPFSAWLYRIAEHEIANSFSKNGHDRVLTEELKLLIGYAYTTLNEDAVLAEIELQKQSEFLAVHENINKLPKIYQQVINLRFFEGKQINQIAQILDKREGTVKSILHRGLEKLRKITDTTATF